MNEMATLEQYYDVLVDISVVISRLLETFCLIHPYLINPSYALLNQILTIFIFNQNGSTDSFDRIRVILLFVQFYRINELLTL